MLLEKINELENHFKEIGDRLGQPETMSDQRQYAQLARSYAAFQPLSEKIKEYRGTLDSLEDAKAMRKEADEDALSEFFQTEIKELTAKRERLEEELKEMMIATDPNDDKDVIMEIRAGTGGDEAALFAGDLFKMYSRYADSQGWKAEIISSSPSDVGGFKEIISSIQGAGAYSRLKHESGVHRVQRIPVTESGGRIHTSAATVAVLPEVEDVEIEIRQEDLRIDIFRSGGPGGQSVNTTDSAVRVTHLPTGLVVQCQDERSQVQNKERALRVLRARLYEKMLEEQQSEIAANRRLQIGSGDRSERIRTYNFPQNRVTDHRVGVSLHRLDSVLEGELQPFVDALLSAERSQKLQEVG